MKLRRTYEPPPEDWCTPGPRALTSDLIGKRFGRLTVTAFFCAYRETHGLVTLWRASCDCGSPTLTFRRSALLAGRTKSCGCLAQEWVKSPRRIAAMQAAKPKRVPKIPKIRTRPDSVQSLARAAGVLPGTVKNRIYRGWGLEEALGTPPSTTKMPFKMEASQINSRLFWGGAAKGPDCWMWQKGVSRDGYGFFHVRVDQGIGKARFRRAQAHRVSYFLTRGTIDDGLLVRHKCHVRACVNPDHLLQGTHVDNMNDLKDRRSSMKAAARSTS